MYFNSQVEKEFHNYPDSVLPIINILKLISLHNPTTRQELSVNSNVYLCILRGLFLFSGDERLRQEAAELLCLLLYSDHIIVVPLDKAIRCKISLPELVVARMCLPLLTHIHWRNSKHLEPDQRGISRVKVVEQLADKDFIVFFFFRAANEESKLRKFGSHLLERSMF